MSTATHETAPRSPRTPHGPNDDVGSRIQKSLKWWLPLSVAFFGIQAAWFLSEREPNGKELTFAYRAHVADSLRDGGRIEAADLHEQLDGIKLTKRDCEKLADETYRCRTSAVHKDHPLLDTHEASEAIYRRDPKGWRLFPLASS